MNDSKNTEAATHEQASRLDVSAKGLYDLATQMLLRAASQWRRLRLFVLGLLALYAVATLALLALSSATGMPMALLTRDMAASLGAKFYLGLLSNIGALLWCAAATTCFLGAAMLRRFPRQQACAAFLTGSGALLTALGLDDFFMLHEVVYPHLGLHEGVLVVLYAAALVALTLRYRAVMLDSDLLLWVIGCLLFLTSVLVDGFVKDATAFEDIPKAAGVCTWLCYYWRLALARLEAESAAHA